MYKYLATLNNKNIVIGVQQALADFVLSDKQLILKHLDYDLLGKHYENGKFNAVAEIEPQLPALITLGFFMLRLTQKERIAIRREARKDSETGEIALDFMKLLESQTVINLEQGQVINGLHFLELIKLLEEGRAAQILGAPITDEERPGK
jgi:hypothetical protein